MSRNLVHRVWFSLLSNWKLVGRSELCGTALLGLCGKDVFDRVSTAHGNAMCKKWKCRHSDWESLDKYSGGVLVAKKNGNMWEEATLVWYADVALMAVLLTISYLLNDAHLKYGGTVQHKGCGFFCKIRSSFSQMMKTALFLMSQALHNKWCIKVPGEDST
jgi:hypothetical protein